MSAHTKCQLLWRSAAGSLSVRKVQSHNLDTFYSNDKRQSCSARSDNALSYQEL